MASAPASIDPIFDVNKLSYDIFKVLESKFLSGYDDPMLFLNGSSLPQTTPAMIPKSPAISHGKVCILSIDAISDHLLATALLAHLESFLRIQSGEPTARIADFFDIAAGSGTGGVISAMLFTRGTDGRPLFSAEEALYYLAKKVAECSGRPRGLFCGMIRKPTGGAFRRAFGEATLRDTVKPLLIPCFDLSTKAQFLFSRADAVESDEFDFRIREICAATCGEENAMEMKSVDGRTRIAAVGGAIAMPNPTAAAITHVLHNKQEFPFVSGVENLLVMSIAGVDCADSSGPSTAEVLRISGQGMADMIDQAIAMAFSHKWSKNYFRLQVHGLGHDTIKGSKKTSGRNPEKLLQKAEETILWHRDVESVLFQGKRLAQETNAQKLERFSAALIEEQMKRRKSPIPTVVIKQSISG